MTTSHDFLLELDALIASKHLLKHPFYLAWSKGELSLECLKEYAQEYYHHVRAFPTYLSALHSRSECPMTRRALLENLIEEEAGAPNHPDLWKNFALALGANEEDLQKQPDSPIQNLIDQFRKICRTHSLPEGIAALYAYERQIPEICVSKIDGLKKHYGMNDPQKWEYFRVHIAADEEHARAERALLASKITQDNQSTIRASVNQILDTLNDFLSSLTPKACTNLSSV